MKEELGSYLNQSIGYNLLETSIVVLTILFLVYVVKLALED